MDKARILIADDDAEMRSLLEEHLRGEGHQVRAASGGEAALRALREAEFDLVLTDLKMPGVDGMEVLGAARAAQPGARVILITAFGTIESAIEAMRQGAFHYVTKPFRLPEIRLVVERALEDRRLRAENLRLRREVEGRYGFGNLVGKSKAMQAVFDLIGRVAGGDSSILITGETGTGKELVAKAVHYNSPRANGPFVPINCASIPEGLLESELFGHVKGAFTGAIRGRKGLFVEAHGGTLFLDEISGMSLPLQAKLLRAIQEREVRPVGGDDAVPIDIRLIAATNQDLKDLVERGSFREDVYYRLAVIPVALPPLRDRQEDVLLLADHFLRRYSEAAGKRIAGFSSEALARLTRTRWPGNVRELENMVERAVNLCRGETIGPEDLGLDLGPSGPPLSIRGIGPSPTLEELSRAYRAQVLAESGGDKERAAKILGVSKRTLYRWERQRRPDGDKASQDVTS